MPDRLTVILPPVPSDEERIAEALDYNSLTEGDGWGNGTGAPDGWAMVMAMATAAAAATALASTSTWVTAMEGAAPMSDRLTVILPPVLSDEERIAEALDYNSLTEGDGWGNSTGQGGGGNGWGDGNGYGTGSGTGHGDGYSFCVGDSDGGGDSSTDV